MFRLWETPQGGDCISLNRVILSGTIGQNGVKLSYTEQAKPQTSLTLACEEPGKDGHTFKTFIPVLIVEPQAEALAERLEPGDTSLLAGKLAYRAGQTKDSGKLLVTCHHGKVLVKAAGVEV